MSVTRKHNDHIGKVLEQLQHREIQIGFFETAVYPDGTPVAYVAAIQEFGSGPIPPRPFLRPAAADNKDKWGKLAASGIKAALREAIQLDDALEQVGFVGAGDVQNAIKAVTSPELSPVTLEIRALKKQGVKISKKVVGIAAQDYALDGLSSAAAAVSAKPLVDTGYMLQSVTSKVETV